MVSERPLRILRCAEGCPLNNGKTGANMLFITKESGAGGSREKRSGTHCERSEGWPGKEGEARRIERRGRGRRGWDGRVGGV